MIYSVKLSSKAEKYFVKLDQTLKVRISDAMKALAMMNNPLNASSVKPLTADLKGFYRLRIGDYRIILAILEQEKIIAVVNIFPRGEAYK